MPKTTAEILADQEAFKAAYVRATGAFMKIDGVVSVGYGLKQTAGEFGEIFAIVVFVHEKKPEDAVAPADRIPPVFEDYPTDVRVMPHRTVQVCDNAQKYSTIQGGMQICNPGASTGTGTSFSAGTLGCIVRRRNHSGRENVYMLSNAHVWYAGGHGAGDNALHPGPNDQSLGPIQEGGAFRNTTWTPSSALPPTVPPRAPLTTFIDCAIARLDLDSCCGCTKDATAFSESIIDLVSATSTTAGRNDPANDANRIIDVHDVSDDLAFAAGSPVKKVGRTTGLTNGTCVGINHGFFVSDPFNPTGPQVHALNCIEISVPNAQVFCSRTGYFSDKGDSGSVILDAQNRIIGLLTAGPDGTKTPPDPPGTTTFACHILPVLDHLGICVPCKAGAASYGYGASLATDGSGLAPIPLPSTQSQLTSQISFLADGASGRAQPTAMAPVPLDEAQGQRMHALLDEFRATQLGRPLYAVIDSLRRELGYLVRNVRPVKVVWGRHQGPAWLTHFLNHIAGHTATIPHEIKGITRHALLVQMREVLNAYGSNALRDALAEHGDVVLDMMTCEGCDSLADVVAWIQEREQAQLVEDVI